MICNQCGAENPDKAKFCNACGVLLKQGAPERPAPGPQPGMRYRRSGKAQTPPPIAQQPSPARPATQPASQTPTVNRNVYDAHSARPPSPAKPAPAMTHPTAHPAGGAIPAARPEVRPAAKAAPRPAPRPEAKPEPKPFRPAELSAARPEPKTAGEIPPNAEAMHRRHQPEMEPPPMRPAPSPRKKSRKASMSDNDNATIMIILALVFFAILAVGAGGVYFNLRDSHPELMRQEAERIDAARAEAEKTGFVPMQEVASADLSFVPPSSSDAVAAEAPAAVPEIPEDIIPHSNPATAETESASFRASSNFQNADARTAAVSEADSTEVAGDARPLQSSSANPYSEEDISRMVRTPETAAGPQGKGYKAQFKQLFGMVIIERTYPSMAMKQRALNLWAREQKILEPDGSINNKYAPKREPSGLIPGH